MLPIYFVGHRFQFNHLDNLFISHDKKLFGGIHLQEKIAGIFKLEPEAAKEAFSYFSLLPGGGALHLLHLITGEFCGESETQNYRRLKVLREKRHFNQDDR